MIRLTDDLVISDDDIVYRFSRSAGPGGQNVNKLNTRVTLLFNLAGCRGLTDEQKKRLLTRLSGRISNDGFLTVVSQRHRTQNANRRSALRRLTELLEAALKNVPVRKQTAIPHAEKRKRLRRKRRRSELKQQRKPVSLNQASD
jgi:ribosome-associated protein